MSTVASPVNVSSALEHFDHGINRVVVSADGRFVATSDVDMNLVVRRGNVEAFAGNFGSTSDKIRPTERVRGLAFSPNAEYLYVAAGDQVIALHTDSWGTEWSYEAPRSFGFLIISPIALDVAANGDVAVAFDNGSIVVWDGHGVKKATIRDNDSPRWLHFVADGNKIVGTDSFSLCGWDIQNRKQKLKIRLAGRAFGLCVDRPGTVAATRTLQNIVLWDLIEKDIVSVIPVGPGIPVLALHPHRKWLAFGERNRVRIVDFAGAPVDTFDLDVTSALSLAFTPSGDELLVGCTEQNLVRLTLHHEADLEGLV